MSINIPRFGDEGLIEIEINVEGFANDAGSMEEVQRRLDEIMGVLLNQEWFTYIPRCEVTADFGIGDYPSVRATVTPALKKPWKPSWRAT